MYLALSYKIKQKPSLFLLAVRPHLPTALYITRTVAHTARRRHGNGIPAVPAPAGGRTHLPTSRLVFSQSGLVGFSSSTQQNALRLVTRAFNTISPISPLALRDTYLKVIRL